MNQKLLTVAAASLLALSALNGAIILHESFDYTAGSLSANNGGTGWSGAWVAGTNTQQGGQGNGVPFVVPSDGLSYPDFVSSGASADELGTVAPAAAQSARSFTAPTGWGVDGNIFWFSVLGFQSSGGAANLMFGTVSSGGAGAGSEAGFGLLLNGGNTNTIYARMGTAGPASVAGTGITNQTVLVVGRVSFSDTNNADALDLWLNPSVFATDAASLGTITSSHTGNINLSGNEVFMRSLNTAATRFDEIRLGNNLSDVLVAVPEPSTYAAFLAVLALAFGIIRRRK